MTNSPTYDEQLVLLKQYEGLGGTKPIPGTSEAEDRFARAAYYLKLLPPKPDNYREAVSGVLSVMRNAATPIGMIDAAHPDISMTQWTSIADSTDRIYYFEFTRLPNIVWVELDEFDLAAGASEMELDLLANPTLVALSGEQASFLAGGEYPIPVVQGTGGGDSITIEYREYGVRVMFRPTVLGDGTIRLHAAPEVSNLSDVGALVLGGFSVPALIVRKAETTLELKNGQTFAMAGLLQHDNQAINSSIPGLGELPILGPLFRSVRYQRRETELVVLVTASLVEPMSLASTPPVPGFLHSEPSDWELYIEGRIEGKEPAKIDPDDARFLEQMGLNRLVGPGAWDSYNAPASSSQAGLVPNPRAGSTNTSHSQTDNK